MPFEMENGVEVWKDNKCGRKIVYNLEKCKEILNTLEQYVNETEIPVLAYFCYKNGIRLATMYEHPILREGAEALMAKKQAVLEMKALNNEVNVTMAIFSLKQMGWTDKQENINRNENKIILENPGLTEDEFKNSGIVDVTE